MEDQDKSRAAAKVFRRRYREIRAGFFTAVVVVLIAGGVALVYVPGVDRPTQHQELVRNLVIAAWTIGAALLFAASAALVTHWRVQRDEAREECDLACDERDACQTTLDERTVSEVHRDELRGILKMLATGVYDDREPKYGPRDTTTEREAFRAHFPACADAVDAYAAARKERDAKEQALKARFEAEIDKRGLSEPPYRDNDLRNLLWHNVRELAYGREGIVFSWVKAPVPHNEGIVNLHTETYGYPLAYGVPEDESDAVAARIDQIYEDSLMWTEAIDFTRADLVGAEAATAAAPLIVDAHETGSYLVRDECVRCRAL